MEADSGIGKLNFVVEQQNYTDYIVICQAAALGRIRQALTVVAPILTAGASGAYISFQGNDPTVKTILALSLVAILGWFCGYLGAVIACYIPRPKYVTEGGCFLGKASLDCGPNEIHWEHQSGARSFFPWGAVKSVQRRKKTIVLMIDNAMGIVVPVNAFMDERSNVDVDARERFISDVEAKIAAELWAEQAGG